MKKTVFVVGAGASTEFAENPKVFPIGTALADRIATQLVNEIGKVKNSPTPSGPITKALMSSGGGLSGETIAAAEKIQLAIVGHESIDDLLADWHNRSEMSRVAKIAIAHAISEAEKRSPLAQIVGGDVASMQSALVALRDSWLGILLRNFKSGRSIGQFIEALQDTAFVVFNYDRAVEKMIYHWIVAITNLRESEAAEIVQTMKIIHPHGSLGTLALGSQEDGFGSELNLAKQASQIKTYSEGGNVIHAKASDVQMFCEMAQKLVFLGFSFHPANNRLLLREGQAPSGDVWATAYKLSGRRRADAHKTFFPGWTDPGEQLADITCSKLMLALADDFAN